MKTAAAYIRVSTDDQLEYSPESQLKVIQDYADKNGIILLEDCIYMESGGKSGKTMLKRDKFLELIAIAKKKPKPFDYILVWKFSRFARNQEEAITLKSMLKRNGIEVLSISEPLPEGPFGDLVERIIEWTDSYYLINLSQEVKRGMKERASRGEPVTPPPIGYSSENGKWVPNTDAEYVKSIFNDFLLGIGLRTIAVKYSNLGLKTKRGNPIDNRCVEYMLRNPAYIGKIRWSIEGRAASTRHYNDPNILIFDGKHQPIISEETFNMVQKKLDEQKNMYGKYQRREHPTKFMLRGLMRCSDCNSTLILINTKSPSLQCHGYARGSCHISHSISVSKANNLVIEYLENAALTENFNVQPAHSHTVSQEVADFDRLIANEQSKLNRIKSAYQDGIDTLEEYKANKKKILNTIEKLEKNRIKEAKPKFDKKSYAKKVFDVLKTIKDESQPEDIKNAALRTIVKEIIFNKKERKIEIYFY